MVEDSTERQRARVPMPRVRSGMQQYYFSAVSALLLILAVIGFSDNLFTDVRQPSNSDPKFVVHGLFWFAWLGIFTAQTSLVRVGDIRRHRRLGVAGMLVAIGVTLSTLYVFAAVWNGWDAMPVHVKANRLFLPCFSLCVFLAWRNRRRSDWHKRLLYIGTVFVQLPILDRTANHFPVPWEAFMLVVWNGLLLSLFAYDWAVGKRIHPATWIGFVGFYAVWTMSALI